MKTWISCLLVSCMLFGFFATDAAAAVVGVDVFYPPIGATLDEWLSDEADTLEDETYASVRVILQRVYDDYEFEESIRAGAFSTNGALLWSYSVPYQPCAEVDITYGCISFATARPTVYIFDSMVGMCALDFFTGEMSWQIPAEGMELYGGVSHAIGKDGTIYVGAYRSTGPVAISPEGDVLWRAECGNDVSWLYDIAAASFGIRVKFAYPNDMTVYIDKYGNRMYDAEWLPYEFADAGMASVIREALGFPNWQEVLLVDLLTLKEIPEDVGENRDIASLEDLRFCDNLEVLMLPRNRVSDLEPLRSLENLTRIRLFDNEVTDISPLSHLYSLTDLSLSSNAITDVTALRYLYSLKRLYLSDNTRLRDIDSLCELDDLVLLDVQGTKVSSSSVDRFQKAQPNCELRR